MASLPRTTRDGDPGSLMLTVFLLAGQYGHRAVIPIEEVHRDWFSHMAPEKFIRELNAGNIPLPVIRVTESQKAPRGVHVHDLARFVEQRRAEAAKLTTQMNKYPAGA